MEGKKAANALKWVFKAKYEGDRKTEELVSLAMSGSRKE